MEYRLIHPDELYHHGVKGMKWGVRRYQNEDGTYTKAGRRRYALDLDVHDTSRRNVAKIRTGEAKRRLDVAKANKNKVNNDYRIADLQARVRSAKRNEKNQAAIDRGAKLASKGMTISRSQTRMAAVAIGSKWAYRALGHHLNDRIYTLQKAGVFRPGHMRAANMLSKYGTYMYAATVLGYGIKAASDQANLRAYNNARWSGATSIKNVGSSEYRDRKDKVTKK